MDMASIDEVVGRASELARKLLVPDAEAIDRDARWPEAGMRALQTAELGGLVVPNACGGLGHGMAALARVCEALAQACPSTGICFGMHCVGAAVIAAKATDDQKQRYLVPIAQGKHLTTLALSEPGTGAHFYIPQTRMVQDGQGAFRVSGEKTFVTNGARADSYVISAAAAEPSAGPGEFSCLIAARDAAGLEWGAPWAGWGMRGNSATTATLHDVLIPQRDLLGSEGDEIWYVFKVITPYFIVAMAGTYLGVAAAALNEGRDHVLRRKYAHTAASIAQNPHVQHRLGELWAQVERTRALIYAAAAKADAGAPDALMALCSAKAEVADCAERVSAETMTLMGGSAYRQESRIQRLYRDARAAHVMSPTTDMLRNWTGRAFLGLPILGD